MFSLQLPFALNQMFSTPFVARSSGVECVGAASVMTPRPPVPMPLMSAYDDPLPDLDQRVRSIGEW